MESNNSFGQEAKITAIEPENSTNQELNDSELDAIAGGVDSKKIPVITITGSVPQSLKPHIPMRLINYLRSL
ncbi:MAG TPA: hypothetical protein DCY88_26860 [Cyanobacteria bacterium UBA11372]|nr:hypothetical protein [Cyanobacteria bacterium UBA11372]HBE36913.1 hypothetical protein [Cyanobacteria bacterium UBA11368]HBE51762.1 hypothetical protein [Cyanobacteria bacterium UBA11369]